MYLVDDKGSIRYKQLVRESINQTEKVIQLLLSERNSNKGIKNIRYKFNIFI